MPKWGWLHVAETSYSDDVMYGKKKQRRGCELAAERYHEPQIKSLQYDIHCY